MTYLDLYNKLQKCFPPQQETPVIIYKYLTIQAATAVVKNHSLRFTPPDEFDDIFELEDPGLIDDSNTEEDPKKRLMSSINYSHECFPVYKALRENVGICCFSDSYDINIMWSLYAQKHKGVVIGFYTEFLPPLIPVEYCSKQEEIKLFSSIEQGACHMIFSKTDDWAWQHEYRTIDLLDNLNMGHGVNEGMFFRMIPPEAIAEINIGTASNERYSPVDPEHEAFEKVSIENCKCAYVYACMKSLQGRGIIERTLISSPSK